MNHAEIIFILLIVIAVLALVAKQVALPYPAAIFTSWRDFRANLSPILLLAIGLVLLTTAVVAVVAHVLAGLPWAAAFALGAIVSPPDAVATTAITSRLRVPRRVVTVLEG